MAKSTSILKKIKRLPQELKRVDLRRDFWLVGLFLLVVMALLILGGLPELPKELSYTLLGILIPLLWITGKSAQKRERFIMGAAVSITILASVSYVFILDIIGVQIHVVGNSYGALEEELKRFNVANRGINSRLVESWSGLTTDERYRNLMKYLEKHKAVDVLELDGIWMEYAIRNDSLLSLDEFIIQDMGEHRFLGTALDVARHPETGSIYGIPLYVDVGLIFYRKDLLGELSNPISLHDLEKTVIDSLAKANGKGILGFIFQGAQYEGLNVFFLEALASENVEITGDDGKVQINSDAARSVLKKLHDMIYLSGTVPPSVLLFEEEKSREIFALGRVLALRNWPYVLLGSRGTFSISQENIGITSFKNPVLGGWYLAIAKETKHPKEAWKVIKFLTSTQMLVDRATNSKLSPRRIPADMKVISDLRNIYPFLRDVERALGRAKARPRVQNYHSFSKSLSSALFKVLSDGNATEKTIKVALDKVQLQLK